MTLKELNIMETILVTHETAEYLRNVQKAYTSAYMRPMSFDEIFMTMIDALPDYDPAVAEDLCKIYGMETDPED